jgi:hypothetical protein
MSVKVSMPQEINIEVLFDSARYSFLPWRFLRKNEAYVPQLTTKTPPGLACKPPTHQTIQPLSHPAIQLSSHPAIKQSRHTAIKTSNQPATKSDKSSKVCKVTYSGLPKAPLETHHPCAMHPFKTD